jgi:NAD(P)-dependent dehydrogenase (short-subunit alcohol dehydrogenase family)
MMGTNCLAPFLLTTLLEPTLRQTAKVEGIATVRVVFVASMIDRGAPKPGGVVLDANGVPLDTFKGMERYMQTKCGDVFLAAEFAKKLRNDNILSLVSMPVPWHR